MKRLKPYIPANETRGNRKCNNIIPTANSELFFFYQVRFLPGHDGVVALALPNNIPPTKAMNELDAAYNT